MTLRTTAKYLWALPNTLLGLCLVPPALLSGGKAERVQGVLEVHGPAIKRLLNGVPLIGGASAITIGHVVIGRDAETLKRCREHEQVHVRQYEKWGPFFLPAYFLSSAAQWAKGGDAYSDNRFEREAVEKSQT